MLSPFLKTRILHVDFEFSYLTFVSLLRHIFDKGTWKFFLNPLT